MLDVACGSGYPALAAARAVRPGGRVVATDLSSRMIGVASDRARAEGLHHIEFVQRDGEDLQFHNESFDAVTNAYGLMFCTEQRFPVIDPERGLVFAVTLLHYLTTPTPSQMYVSEVFKVVGGRIVRIDNIGLMTQGVSSLGFIR